LTVARTLRINVLGPFEAFWSNGQAVKLTTKKAQALLAFLAVEHARPRAREFLATLLWSEMNDENARHNLRQVLSKIKKACGEVVDARGEILSLDSDAVHSDVAEFERLASSENADELEACMALYRGDLLEGFVTREPVFDEWLAPARSRLRRIACESAVKRSQLLRDQSRREDCIAALNELLAIDPAYEPAHRDLMQFLADVGRRSDALRQYQICAEVLDRELGAEPSQETQELFAGLKKTSTAAAVSSASTPKEERTKADHPTMAVLPFENLSGEENAYFVDGLVEDLITSLSCFRSLLVIARGSSFAYRNSELTDQAIAAQLGAQFLVRGSIQRAGNRVRINVQLLDARTGLTVWGHRYDREIEDVFVLQDEITSTLVSTLAGRVEAARLAQARKAPAERLDAYDYLLRGKDYHHRFTADDCDRCIQMFEHAIERDPTYAVAYAWLGCGLGQAMVFGLDDIPKLVDRAQAAAERGLELDQDESECHRILAQVNLTRGDLSRAFRHQERALKLNPNDDRSVCAMGEILSFLGRHEEAEQWVRKSMRLNPYHPERYWTHLVRPLLHLGRCSEALEALEHIGHLRRDDHVYAVAASAGSGDEAALENAVQALRVDVPDFDGLQFVATLPYERAADRELIHGALVTAGFIAS
jgi:TolB-like protein